MNPSARERVTTGMVSKAVRNSSVGGVKVKAGDYVGIAKDDIVSADASRCGEYAHIVKYSRKTAFSKASGRDCFTCLSLNRQKNKSVISCFFICGMIQS